MSLSFDPSVALAHLHRADKPLSRLMVRAGEYCLSTARLKQSPFEALLQAIVFQQLAGAAARKIFDRVEALLPKTASKKPRALLELPETALRGAGLSQNKLLSVRDLATKTVDGVVPTLARLKRMDDETIIEHLTSVRGIGEWTAHMFLMFRLGRPDVLPTGDYGVRKGFMYVFRTKELPTPAEMHRRAERWRPYRSVASWYMWRAVDLAEGKKVTLPAAETPAASKKSVRQTKAGK